MLLNKSFSRRIGKTLSSIKKDLLANELPNYIINDDIINSLKYKPEIILEIGFGMGEHFIHQVKASPEKFFIGAEVYVSGIANILKSVKENNHSNFTLWPDSIDLLLDHLPNSILKIIYILFPDPWPKRRQMKKRLINSTRLSILIDKLKSGGRIIFASDIEDYFVGATNLIKQNNQMTLQILNDETALNNYTKTKYHLKAINEHRVAQFLIATKIT